MRRPSYWASSICHRLSPPKMRFRQAVAQAGHVVFLESDLHEVRSLPLLVHKLVPWRQQRTGGKIKSCVARVGYADNIEILAAFLRAAFDVGGDVVRPHPRHLFF